MVHLGRRHPLILLACGFAAGAAFSPAVPGPWPLAAISLALTPVPGLAPLGLALGGAAAGAFAARGREPGGAPPVEGRVVSMPERRDGRVRFVLEVPSGARISLTAPPPAWPVALGDRVRVRAALRFPPGARNPGGPDRAARLAARGVRLEGAAGEPPVRVAPPSPLAAIEAARTRFAQAASAALPPREAALVRALGAGDASAVDSRTREAFGRTGLAHLLSVSGLHLAVVALGLWRLLSRALNRWDAAAARLDPRRAAAAAALPAAALYALATGAQVPVVRSAVAASAAFLGVLLSREARALDALALAALAVLGAEPAALREPSFQLSFASVAGLVLLAPRLRSALPFRAPAGLAGRAAGALLSAACAGAAATLATAPILACHFHRLPLLAVPANVAGVPVGIALTVISALAFLAGAAFGPAGIALLWAARPLASLLLLAGDLFAAPRWASLAVASPGLGGALAAYALGGAALLARGRRRGALAAAAALALLGPGPLRSWAAGERGLLEVVFLSVGQGDSTFLRLPDGSAVLVDAPGEAAGYDPGARDVAPFLLDAGVRRLAAAFASHPHHDHLLGLPAVAEAVPVERFLGNGRGGDEPARAALGRLPPARPLRAGDVLDLGGVRFEVLAPGPGSEAFGENDASLVLRVRHGEVSFLLPGDVELEGQRALLARGGLAADVVKVPHHGARSSALPAFAEAVRPRWAVASLSRSNPFGFPHPEAVAVWTGVGARFLRTDQEGAVRFLSDGRRVWRADPAAAVDAVALWRERRRP